MLTPDLDLARRFIATHPPPGRLLLCGITGAHHYGFPSPDSDIDSRYVPGAPVQVRAPRQVDAIQLPCRADQHPSDANP